MPSYQFADLAAGRVTSGGTTAPTSGSSESWTVAAVTGTFPTLTAGQVFDVVDPAVPSELMTVTATASSTAWTVTRGAYGTTPLAHLSGFQVRNVVTAAGINAIGNGTFRAMVAASSTAGTAIQGAITAAGASGGEIVLAPGTHTWDVIPLLPRNLTGRLSISCMPGAKILLTSGAPRAFDWGKVADYDTFQHLDIGPLTVDCNNIGGRHHVVVGPWQAGSWQRKINLDDVHVHDVRILNAPVGTDSATDFRIGVHIGMAASELSDTRCTATNCSVRRVWSDGCLQLVAIHGVPVGAETTANVYHDTIVVEDIDHALPTTPSAFNAGAHVMAGTKGTGGKLTIRRVRGSNSPDVGIEWDGWQYATLHDIEVQDAYDFNFYHVNYKLPSAPEAQQSNLTGCVGLFRSLNRGQSFKIDVANGNRPGSVDFGAGCLHHRWSTSDGSAVQYEALDALGPRRLTGTLQSVVEMPTYSGSTDIAPSAFLIRSNGTSNRTDPRLRLLAKVTGTRAGTGLINWRSLLLREGLLTNFDIDLESDVNISNGGNASALIHADIGSTSVTTSLSGRLRVVIPAGAAGNIPTGVQFESGSFNTVPNNEEIVLDSSNMAGLGSTSTEVIFTGATTLASRVRYRNNTWRTFPQSRRPVASSVSIDGRADLVAITDTTAARTLTLPAANGVPPGRIITFKDEFGTAGTNNITINRSSTDTIEGATSVAISTNYGSVSLYSTGTAWCKAA